MRIVWGVFLGLAGAIYYVPAADLAVERPPNAEGVDGAEQDSYVVLRWDNSYTSWLNAWTSGADAWVGNDFDVSTLKTFSRIREMSLYSYYGWPNRQWDGFCYGIFAFEGSVPGSLLWPTSGTPRFFPVSGAHGWKTMSLYWVLPAGRKSFVAAMEQYYDFPNCDPYTVDTNLTFRGHSWQRYGGQWQPLVGTAGYRNLMLRVVVDNEMVGVKPSSLGRIKGLYY